jgi:hypothetical protein
MSKQQKEVKQEIELDKIKNPVLSAAYAGNWLSVSQLLTLGTYNVDAVSESGPYKGVTALWLAAVQKKWDIILKLLAAGAKNIDAAPESGPDKGLTALWFAAAQRNWDIVLKLLAAGAKNIDAAPESGPYKGVMALWFAANTGICDSILALLNAGADPYAHPDILNLFKKCPDKNIRKQIDDTLKIRQAKLKNKQKVLEQQHIITRQKEEKRKEEQRRQSLYAGVTIGLAKGSYHFNLLEWGVKPSLAKRLHIPKKIILEKAGVECLSKNLEIIKARGIFETLLKEIYKGSEEWRKVGAAAEKELANKIQSELLRLKTIFLRTIHNEELPIKLNAISKSSDSASDNIGRSQDNLNTGRYQLKRKGEIIVSKQKGHLQLNEQRMKEIKKINQEIIECLIKMGKIKSQGLYYQENIILEAEEGLKNGDIAKAGKCLTNLEDTLKCYEILNNTIGTLAEKLDTFSEAAKEQLQEEERSISHFIQPISTSAAIENLSISKSIAEYSLSFAASAKEKEEFNEVRRIKWLEERRKQKEQFAQAREKRKSEKQQKIERLKISSLIEGSALDNQRQVREKPALILSQTVMPAINLQEELHTLEKCISEFEDLKTLQECELNKYGLLGAIARVFEMSKFFTQGGELAKRMRNNLFHLPNHLLLPFPKNKPTQEVFAEIVKLALEVKLFVKAKKQSATLESISNDIKSTLLPYLIHHNKMNHPSLSECIKELEELKSQLESIRSKVVRTLLEEETYQYFTARMDTFCKKLTQHIKAVENSLPLNQQDLKLTSEQRETARETAKELQAARTLLGKLNYSENLAKQYRHESRRNLTHTSTPIIFSSSEVPQDEFVTKTRGEGDCAFHAALGKWNGEVVECKNLAEARKKLADIIRSIHEDSPMFNIVLSAIEIELMDEGNRFKGLKAQRVEFYQKNKETVDAAWGQFEEELKNCKDIMEFITQNSMETHFSQLRNKFFHCLNLHQGQLYNSISHYKELNEKFIIFNKKLNQGFDLFSSISGNKKNILEEYAQYIEKKGQWLLPVEFELIAYVWNLNVQFYTYNPYLKTRSGPHNINPNGKERVAVCFDGVNHFERVLDKHLLANNSRELKQKLEIDEKQSSILKANDF